MVGAGSDEAARRRAMVVGRGGLGAALWCAVLVALGGCGADAVEPGGASADVSGDVGSNVDAGATDDAGDVAADGASGASTDALTDAPGDADDVVDSDADGGDVEDGDGTAVALPDIWTDASTPDTGTPDTGTPDTGTPDTGGPDTGTPDTGTPDSGTPDTGGPDTDMPDTGTPDSGTPDTGGPDTDTPDTGTPDTGTPDTGVPDTGTPDTGTPDTGVPDTGVPDAGTPDTGTPDAGTPDAGAPDTSAPDTGPTDAGPPTCKATWQGGRLVHGDAPPLVQVDPVCGLLSYGRYKARGDAQATHLLPDYSHAGYMGGGVAIPTVPVAKTLTPIAGDDRAQIQAAINAVSALKPDKNGVRGAVLLGKGTYQVDGTLTIAASGVVLRGAGQGAGGTVLVATKKAQHDLIRLQGGGSGWKKLAGTTTQVTSMAVPVGALSFQVTSAKGLKVGMTIAVRHTRNAAWIDLLGMGKYGWKPSGYSISHERRVVALSGNTVTVDIPLVDAIVAKHGGAEVFGVDFSSRIAQCGVEDLRLTSVYASATDEKHGWNAVRLSRVVHSWVRRVTAVHFGNAAVSIHGESSFNTIEEVAQLDPKSQVTGGRRYSFNVTDGIGNLFQRCYARDGRHNFVTGSGVTGPNVWLDSLSMKNNSDEGPHHRWATGLLFDSCMSAYFHVQNRKTSGTGHGWAGAQTLFWNVLATEGVRCDAPKGAMNWSVGAVGAKLQGTWAPEEPFGHFESHGKPVAVRSLYLAQLKDRLGQAAVAAVTLPQQSGRVWNLLNSWAGKAALASTIPTKPKTCAGIVAGSVCCAKSCGVCGGTGCGALPGGSTKCCSGAIKKANKSCAKSAPPCVIP